MSIGFFSYWEKTVTKIEEEEITSFFLNEGTIPTYTNIFQDENKKLPYMELPSRNLDMMAP